MIQRELQPTSYTAASTEFTLDPDYDHAFTLNGSGTWQIWNGAAWLDYEESNGTTQAFRAFPPGTGRINLAVSSGTVTAGFRRIQPEGRRTKGKY